MTKESQQAADAPGGGQPRHLDHTWEEARQAAFDAGTPIPAGPVPLELALGRRLDQDIVALQEMPHYASSAMDGWTVNGTGPWVLTEPGKPLGQGQASPVVTGGVIPPGSQAVLRVESGQLAANAGGKPILVVAEGASPGEPRQGQHIR